MAVTEDMRVIINGEADDLDHIRKSGMSFDDLTGEFSRYLAQATLVPEVLPYFSNSFRAPGSPSELPDLLPWHRASQQSHSYYKQG